MIVHRKAYTRSDGTRVRATTYSAPNLGRPGRGPKLFKLRKGLLKKYGYPDNGRNALARAVNSNGPLAVFRRLQALMILTKRTQPNRSNRYRANRNWIRSTYM